jgi:hypothetical protein
MSLELLHFGDVIGSKGIFGDVIGNEGIFGDIF